MPHHMNDPTSGWQGFYVTDLLTEHVDSDDYGSDYIPSKSLEDEDEPLDTRVRSGRRCVEFNKAVDMRDPKFEIGMIFPTLDSFKRALKEYSIVKHRAVRLVKNDKGKVRAMCLDGYSWTVYASVKSDGFSFKVKTINDDHTYGLN